ncbi:MAG: hypothetical protein NTV86_12805 [Planctomycetota bacterium]|nr:hypothetical protein [Planctomycetota bacterium]
MELDTCAVIGRLTMAANSRPTEGPSTYNISRLGLAPSVSPGAASQAPAPRPPEEWPIVIAEPVRPPAPAQAAPPKGHPTGLRRKASFALPADLLERVRARAVATGAFQYAVVTEALQGFFHGQVEALARAQSGPQSVIACVRRILKHIVGRSPRSS